MERLNRKDVKRIKVNPLFKAMYERMNDKEKLEAIEDCLSSIFADFELVEAVLSNPSRFNKYVNELVDKKVSERLESPLFLEKKLKEINKIIGKTDRKSKIDKTLEIIKLTQDFLDKQKLEWNMETKGDDADKFANTYFEAQKVLLEKLKKANRIL